MKNPCRSYTLNIMSLVAWICFGFYGKLLIDMFVAPSGGDGDFIAFFYIPASLTFLGLCTIGLIIEYIFYTTNNRVFAFDFPYKKIPLKIIYYLLFYFGLLYGSFWGLYTIIAIPFIFLFNNIIVLLK
ncbi:MAG: hypothetical protein NC390_02875 [Fusobacterium sp.]|nr:hypothetical protein [Fusobacterium sp.]